LQVRHRATTEAAPVNVDGASLAILSAFNITRTAPTQIKDVCKEHVRLVMSQNKFSFGWNYFG
jgi:hypothetical protein